MDSCCIDKTSRAELSEAINSMFVWNQTAQVFYAYLADVPGEERERSVKDSAFRKIVWFTRGWTLQELLAPKVVTFFDQNWVDIGTRSSLKSLIAHITGMKLSTWREACIARKFSWAAKRKTTREEDLAYCLMGLYGINMPLLYGEGMNAFMRLQLEIIKVSDDELIFAREDYSFQNRGPLALSLTNFDRAGKIQRKTFDEARPPYSMTNKGLHIEPLLDTEASRTLQKETKGGTFLMPLNCGFKNQEGCLSIYVKDESFGQFSRGLIGKTHSETRVSSHTRFEREAIYLRQPSLEIQLYSEEILEYWASFNIQVASLEEYGILESNFYITDGTCLIQSSAVAKKKPKKTTISIVETCCGDRCFSAAFDATTLFTNHFTIPHHTIPYDSINNQAERSPIPQPSEPQIVEETRMSMPHQQHTNKRKSNDSIYNRVIQI